jgi:DNA-binding phage protein
MAKAKPFDAAEYLDSPEMIAAYLTEALESNDQALITKAIWQCGSLSWNDRSSGKGRRL